MFKRLVLAGPLALTLSAAVPAWQTAAPAPAAIDVQGLGPQVGTLVPPFSLPDQSGTIRTLQSIMGSRGAVLVFFRSADW